MASSILARIAKIGGNSTCADSIEHEAKLALDWLISNSNIIAGLLVLRAIGKILLFEQHF